MLRKLSASFVAIVASAACGGSVVASPEEKEKSVDTGVCPNRPKGYCPGDGYYNPPGCTGGCKPDGGDVDAHDAADANAINVDASDAGDAERPDSNETAMPCPSTVPVQGAFCQSSGSPVCDYDLDVACKGNDVRATCTIGNTWNLTKLACQL